MGIDVSKIHRRKCWDCGNIAEHTDNVVPEVLCKKCGSQDTRVVKDQAVPPAVETRKLPNGQRIAFEAWVTSPPYERIISRWPADEYAWPGQYRHAAQNKENDV